MDRCPCSCEFSDRHRRASRAGVAVKTSATPPAATTPTTTTPTTTTPATTTPATTTPAAATPTVPAAGSAPAATPTAAPTPAPRATPAKAAAPSKAALIPAWPAPSVPIPAIGTAAPIATHIRIWIYILSLLDGSKIRCGLLHAALVDDRGRDSGRKHGTRSQCACCEGRKKTHS